MIYYYGTSLGQEGSSGTNMRTELELFDPKKDPG